VVRDHCGGRRAGRRARPVTTAEQRPSRRCAGASLFGQLVEALTGYRSALDTAGLSGHAPGTATPPASPASWTGWLRLYRPAEGAAYAGLDMVLSRPNQLGADRATVRSDDQYATTLRLETA
jgi:hypothetical protein